MRGLLPRIAVTVLLALCALAASTGPSTAATPQQFTASNIASPASGSVLFYDGDNGGGAMTVIGTVTGAGPRSAGDLICSYNAGQRQILLLSGIDVSSGRFSREVSLGAGDSTTSLPGEACRLRLVPSSSPAPAGSALAAFNGPAIAVNDRYTLSATGNPYGYKLVSGTLAWSFSLGSLGQCPIGASYATDPLLLFSDQLFAGDACLPSSSGISSPGRSALQIDGQNAYPPGAIPSLSGQVGFAPLSYTAAFDPGHDAGTVAETDIPTVCDPPDAYPPNIFTCPGLHGAGIGVRQTTTLLAGGQVARVSQQFRSLDGRAHHLDLLFGQSTQAPIGGLLPGFEFPGQSTFTRDASPDSFATFPRGPSSIVAIGDPAGTPSSANPVGSITYGTPPTGASFITAAGSRTATFLMHYAATVPAGGAVTYNWSFAQAASLASLASLEAAERDRFFTPAVRIGSPHLRQRVSTSPLRVTGAVFDPLGIASLTVDGRPAAIAANGAFSARVALRPGQNTITVRATNRGGTQGSASVRVRYAPRPCVVPELTGRTLAAAERALHRAHCSVGRLRRRTSATARGRVISTVPGARSAHRSGYRVGLVVSRGRRR